MSKKIRFLNSHKEWLRDNLIRNFEKQFFMTHEAAVAAVTGTSTPAYVDIGRRIVHNCPDYETTHTFDVDDVRRAIGEWLAYKAGVRIEGPVTVDPHAVQQETARDVDPCVSESQSPNDEDNGEEPVESEAETTVESEAGTAENCPESQDAEESAVGNSPVMEMAGEAIQAVPSNEQSSAKNDFDDIVPF